MRGCGRLSSRLSLGSAVFWQGRFLMRRYLVVLLSTVFAVGMSLSASPSFAQAKKHGSGGAASFKGGGAKTGGGRGSGRVAGGGGRQFHGGGRRGGSGAGNALAVGAAVGLLGVAIGAAAAANSEPAYYGDRPPPPRYRRPPPGVYYDYDD